MAHLRVLLIDDDPDVSETIMSVFNGFYSVDIIEHITSGDQFKKGAWRTPGWHIIILDLMMPGITGFEVCEYLKSYEATKNVPILALTGYDTLQNEQKIKKAGANGYMAKPFEIAKFNDEVKRLLTKSGVILS